MFGFIFGSICMLGLVGMAARSAIYRHHAYGGGCHGGFAYAGPGFGSFGRHGVGGPGGRRSGVRNPDGVARALGEVLKRRLNIDEEQELIVDHALLDARKALRVLHEEVEGTRAGIADALRGETVDDSALAAAFVKHDDAVAKARRELVSATRQVHAVLDADQRKIAADLINQSKTGWWS